MNASIYSGEGNGNPLHYSCLENPMDGGAWWAAVHGVAKSSALLSNFTFTFHLPDFQYNNYFLLKVKVKLLSRV